MTYYTFLKSLLPCLSEWFPFFKTWKWLVYFSSNVLCLALRLVIFFLFQMENIRFCILNTIFFAQIMFYRPITFLHFWRAHFPVVEVISMFLQNRRKLWLSCKNSRHIILLCFSWLHDFQKGMTWYSWIIWGH